MQEMFSEIISCFIQIVNTFLVFIFQVWTYWKQAQYPQGEAVELLSASPPGNETKMC